MNEKPHPSSTDCPPSTGSRLGAASSSRVDVMLEWLKANRGRIESAKKGQLILNFGGNSVVPELVEKFEPLS